MAKRGSVRPWRMAYEWTGPTPVRGTETFATGAEALARAVRQVETIGGTSGERNCLAQVAHRDEPAEVAYFRACPSCGRATRWDEVAREWRHVEPAGAYRCSDGTEPPHAGEGPVPAPGTRLREIVVPPAYTPDLAERTRRGERLLALRPRRRGAIVVDRDGHRWEQGTTRWTCLSPVNGYDVTAVGRLPWSSLVEQYGPVTILDENEPR